MGCDFGVILVGLKGSNGEQVLSAPSSQFKWRSDSCHPTRMAEYSLFYSFGYLGVILTENLELGALPNGS